MKVGYARVSSGDRTTALQSDALRDARCEKVFVDKSASAAAVKRPALDRCLNALREGDVLVVWKLDRLARSLSHLLELAAQLRERGIGFQSLSESIDTTAPQGTLVFHIMGALAQFERGLIAERGAAGREAARKRGVRFGRPVKLTQQQRKRARELREQGKPVPEIAELLNVSRATAYRALA
jgi:DNA invertase Pin-like site-specific DNA recombinase